MGFRLFSESPEERQERLEEEQALRSELGSIEAELSLYQMPEWNLFLERLQEIERANLEQLVGCPPEEVMTARERIKLVRHLAEISKTLEARQAVIRGLLSPEEE